MTTQAIKALGIAVKVGDDTPLAALTITGATNATPIVVTTSANHGMTTPDVITIAGVGGNTAANGTWIITRVSDTTFSLRGSVGNGAYTSGGTATRQDTYATIAELLDAQGMGRRLAVQEVTAHDGTGDAEFVPTALSANAVRLMLNAVPDAPTHDEVTGLQFLIATRAKRRFLIVLPDTVKTAVLYTGFVADHPMSLPFGGILATQVTLEFTGPPLMPAAA